MGRRRRGGNCPRDSTALPPFSASVPPPTLLPPDLPSIKSQSGARWLRPILTSPPPPPPSSTQPAGHWRQGPEVSQFYAAPWTLGRGGCHRMAGGERADEESEAGAWSPPPAQPHLSSEAQASACCSCCKSDLASSCMPAAGQLLPCRVICSGRSCPPASPPSRHTAASYSQICRSQGARVAGGVGAYCDYAPDHYGQYCMNLKRPVASRCRGGSKRNQTV